MLDVRIKTPTLTSAPPTHHKTRLVMSLNTESMGDNRFISKPFYEGKQPNANTLLSVVNVVTTLAYPLA